MFTKLFLLLKLSLNSGSFFSELFNYTWYSDPLRAWISDLGINSSHYVVELGCGSGELSYWISDIAKYVVGADKDFRKINSARVKFKKNNLEFKIMDINSSQPTKIKFNYCVGASILNVINDPKKIIKTMEECCSNGGVISFIQPSMKMNKTNVNQYLLSYKLNKKERSFLHMWCDLSQKMNPEGVKEIFSSMNFENISIKYYFNDMLFSITGSKKKR